LQTSLRHTLEQSPALRLDYAEIVAGETLEPVVEAQPGAVALVAAYFGQTRLIDNVLL